jgi:hypothetical protein
MATYRVRSYYDGGVKTDRTLEEIDKDLEYWEKVNEELKDWVDPDLAD